MCVQEGISRKESDVGTNLVSAKLLAGQNCLLSSAPVKIQINYCTIFCTLKMIMYISVKVDRAAQANFDCLTVINQKRKIAVNCPRLIFGKP